MACASRDVLPVAASQPSEVDPLADVVAIPPGSCLGLDDHFAISTDGVKALLVSVREQETRAAVQVATCKRDARLALAHAEAIERDASSVAWWARWGPLFGAAIGVVVGASVPTAILLLRH